MSIIIIIINLQNLYFFCFNIISALFGLFSLSWTPMTHIADCKKISHSYGCSGHFCYDGIYLLVLLSLACFIFQFLLTHLQASDSFLISVQSTGEPTEGLYFFLSELLFSSFLNILSFY